MDVLSGTGYRGRGEGDGRQATGGRVWDRRELAKCGTKEIRADQGKHPRGDVRYDDPSSVGDGMERGDTRTGGGRRRIQAARPTT